MRRTTFAFIFACCTLALVAQDVIKVNFKGSKPTISDFAWAYLSDYEYDENGDDCLDEARAGVKQAWSIYRKGGALGEGEKLNVDSKNGYAIYEHRSEYESVENVFQAEMCYLNESDGKHKLFAYNVKCFTNGRYSPGQFDGLLFYRYNNATKKMTYYEMPGFDASLRTEDDAYITYSLPRTGKDIVVTYWYDNGTKRQKTLKWNGRRFNR